MADSSLTFWKKLVLPLLVTTILSCGYSAPADVAGVGDVPPEVTETKPKPFEAEVGLDAIIRIRFSKAILLSKTSISLSSFGLPVEGDLALVDDTTVDFIPVESLSKGSAYTVAVERVSDIALNEKTSSYTYQFTTITSACVKPNGVDGCYALPSVAVSLALPGDSIAVAAGDYIDHVRIEKDVRLLGGYGDSMLIRDPLVNVTRIKGNNSSRSLVEIVTRDGMPQNKAILDGFHLVDHTRSDDHGGALRIIGSNARITNNTIMGNKAYFIGGGVYISGGLAYLSANTIEGNALLDGGEGGGIAVENANVHLDKNIIVNNRIPAMTEAGAGGGISIFSNSTAMLVSNRIESNTASDGIFAGNGGGISISASNVKVTGGTISGNNLPTLLNRTVDDAGAGLFVTSLSDVVLMAVTIENNIGPRANSNGASGAHVKDSRLSILSSVIANNQHGSAGVNIGPLGSLIVLNSTIASNAGKGVQASAPFLLANSIVIQHSLGVYAVPSTPATDGRSAIINSVFYQNAQNLGGIPLGVSNVVVDPQLDDRYRLKTGSPLIDAGSEGPFESPLVGSNQIDLPEIDIDNEPRVSEAMDSGGKVDVGADEYHLGDRRERR
jgi:hypothetical protein